MWVGEVTALLLRLEANFGLGSVRGVRVYGVYVCVILLFCVCVCLRARAGEREHASERVCVCMRTGRCSCRRLPSRMLGRL